MNFDAAMESDVTVILLFFFQSKHGEVSWSYWR